MQWFWGIKNVRSIAKGNWPYRRTFENKGVFEGLRSTGYRKISEPVRENCRICVSRFMLQGDGKFFGSHLRKHRSGLTVRRSNRQGRVLPVLREYTGAKIRIFSILESE